MQNIIEVEMTVFVKGCDYQQAAEKLHKILHREYIQIVTIKEKGSKLPPPKLTFDEE